MYAKSMLSVYFGEEYTRTYTRFSMNLEIKELHLESECI